MRWGWQLHHWFNRYQTDFTPPAVSLNGLQHGQAYLQGQVPTASCTTTDALSGVSANATVSTTNNGGGSFTTSCNGAIDVAGNSAQSTSVTYSIVPGVRNLATNSRFIGQGNNFITASISNGGAPINDVVTFALSLGTQAGQVSCSDSKGNTYTTVVNKPTGAGRLLICASKITHALVNGDTVLATYPGMGTTSLISVNAISSLTTSGVIDGTASDNDNSSAVNSGAIAATSQSVLFGVVGHNNTPTFSAGSGFTLVGAITAGTGNDRRTLSPEFRIAPSAGNYAATGTMSQSHMWRAVAIAYRAP